MKKPIWDIRIPTLFALLLAAGSIFVTGFFLQQRTSFTGKASQEAGPANIIVTDITDTSFTVAFTTISPAASGIKVSGPSLPGSVFYASTSQEEYVTHRITVPNLSPQTEYSFEIITQGKTLLDNGHPYIVKTGTSFEEEPSPYIINGTIITPDGENASNVLVTLSSEGTQALSTITDQDGKFSFDIGKIKSPDLSQYATLTKSTVFILNAYYRDLSSRVQIQNRNISDIPPITLSQNYDFGQADEEPIIATSESQFNFPIPSKTYSSFTVSFPSENQSLIDNKPVIRGTALPRSEVQLTINGQLSQSVLVNSSGIWQFRPQEELPQGENTVLVNAKDSLGIKRTITRVFSVFPSGSQVIQSASPSASLTPTVTVTSTPSPTSAPTVTTTITPSPSASITQTPSPSPTPTATITPTPTTSIVTDTPIPTVQPIITITPTPPGSLTTVLITFTSVILIIVGTTLLFILG